VGVSALVLGAVLVNYLDAIEFDTMVETMLGVDNNGGEQVEDSDKKGFYASLVVMAVTGLYSYVLLNIVNKPSTKEEEQKKEKEL